MATFMKESGTMTKLKAKALICIKTVLNIQVNGMMTSNTATVLRLGPTKQFTRVTIYSAKSIQTGPLSGTIRQCSSDNS